MKKLLTIAFLCITIHVNAQIIKVVQSGNYGTQTKRNYFSVSGIVTEKHKYKFFNWVTLSSNDTLFKVSVVDSSIYNKLIIGKEANLKKCFKLSSRTWRRKPI